MHSSYHWCRGFLKLLNCLREIMFCLGNLWPQTYLWVYPDFAEGFPIDFIWTWRRKQFLEHHIQQPSWNTGNNTHYCTCIFVCDSNAWGCVHLSLQVQWEQLSGRWSLCRHLLLEHIKWKLLLCIYLLFDQRDNCKGILLIITIV